MTGRQASTRLEVDVDTLTRLARQYVVLADEMHETIQNLTFRLAAHGEPWGDDEPGREFAAQFVPALREVLDGLTTVRSNVHAQGANLAAMIKNLQVADAAVASTVGQADPDSSQAVAASAAASPGSIPPVSSPADSQPTGVRLNGSIPRSPWPVAQSPRPQMSETRSPIPGHPLELPQTQSAQQNPSSPDQNPNGGPSNPAQARQHQIGAPAERQLPRDTSTRATYAPRVAAPTDSVHPRTGPTPANSGQVTVSPISGAKPPVGPPGPASTQPGADNSSPQSPQSPKRNRVKTDNPTAKPPKPEARGLRPERRPREIARLLRERHSISVSGLDDNAMNETVCAEFAAALDDILPAYPAIDLREAAIAELPDGQMSTAVWNWRSGPNGPAPYTARIVLATNVARDPTLLAERVASEVAAGELVAEWAERPVYSTVVRELGCALDVAGHFRARREVQHALIDEHVRSLPPPLRLRTVIDSYRVWRADLSPHSFYGPRLLPGAALAEAFTEVQLRGPEACAPARVLHRLLTATAAAFAVTS
ncbi:hypothetical protein [Nocardia sp. NPDC057030]|uniref:WXG100 family type VII secretion target n=1 Tax=unclassified Nocardia TaxID=2637762 RepID=UPI00362F221E